MSVVSIFKLNNTDQLDLFFSKSDGNLDLQKVAEKMQDFSAPSESGEINGEGFIGIETTNRMNTNVIEAYATGQGSLGYFNQAYINDDETVTSTRKQQKFYSKGRIIITENKFLLIFFNDTTEEKIKSNLKALVEKLGFEITNFRLTDELMRQVREKYTWTEVRLEKVNNESDSTTKVYYEIDIADSTNNSKIDEIYKDHGKMVQISYEMPYNENTDGIKLITVKLYKNDHRIVLREEELGNDNNFKKFIIHLAQELNSLIE